MSISNFQHVPIPFDQLGLFHDPENQIFLLQTLFFSTKINLHVNKRFYSSFLIITKHNIWFKDQKKTKNIFALPTQLLLFIIKSHDLPEIVFVTDKPYDNIRITVSNQQRCNSIISGLSYLFSRILKNHSPLKVFIAKQTNLKAYEKTCNQKVMENFVQTITAKLPSQQIVYKEAVKQQIYGYLNLQNKRVFLMKQIYNSKNHMIHVAKVVSNNFQQDNLDLCQKIPNTVFNSQYNSIDQYFYLHTIEKTQKIMQTLRSYTPFPYQNCSEELLYVRQLDYKIQLFFRYLSQIPKQGSPYYNYQLSPERLFINLMEFYDIILMQRPQTVLNFSLLCFQTISKQKQCLKDNKELNNKRSFKLTEEYSNSFSQITVKLRQFRYEFLLTGNNQLMKMIYQCYYEKEQLIYDPYSWKTKFYHLSLILYEFMYGNQYFSQQLEPQVILQIKKSKKVIFPKYLNAQSEFLMSCQLQDFMEKSMKLRFKSIEDVYQHPWMKQNVLILAYELCPRKLIKNEDKKTDATKSF